MTKDEAIALVNRGYINIVIVCVSIFAAGVLMFGVVPAFFFIVEEFNVGAMMVGFLMSAFVLGLVVFGGLMLFKAEKFAAVNLRWIIAASMGIIGILGLLMGYVDYWPMWVFRFAVGFVCGMLIIGLIFLSLYWFPKKLNIVAWWGIISLLLGVLVAAFFGSMFIVGLGGWRNVYLIFGGVGVVAFVSWLVLGRAAPYATNGGEPAAPEKGPAAPAPEKRPPAPPPERGPAARVLGNRSTWCLAGTFYLLLCFFGVFTFVFIALAGRFEFAEMVKLMIFPMEFYLAALLNGLVIILSSMIVLRSLPSIRRKRLFIVIPGFLAPIAGLVVISLPFSGVWMAVIIELMILNFILLAMVVATWIVQIQELPGIGLDTIFNAIGAILLISGIAGAIVLTALGWALDQGWATFKLALYFFVGTWAVCGLAGLLMPESAGE